MEGLLLVIGRTIFLYFVIMLIFRLMGKREIGELSIIDIVVYIMIAELAVLAIERPAAPFISAIVPMIVLMAIQMVTAFFSLKSKRFRDLLEGEPVILINNGKIDEHAMRKQRYNLDDLMLQLRQKDIRNIGDVEFAILENTGELSVFKKEQDTKGVMVPLVMDGELQKNHLRLIGKDEEWLAKHLRKLGVSDFDSVSLCSYEDGRLFVDLKDDNK